MPQMPSDPLVVLEDKAVLQVDNSGLPLIPQPSTSPIDPLNYPTWLKYLILLEVSLLAFVSTMSVTIMSPAIPQVAHEFSVSPHVATYQSTANTALGAVLALLVIPFANAYGHRLVFILSSLLAALFMILAAEATSFVTLVVFLGLVAFQHVNLVLGIAVIPELFFVHQRGRATGFYVFLHNLSHLSPVIGGYIALQLGWRWTLRFGAILIGFMLLLIIFLLPDTLFQRAGAGTTPKPENDFRTLKIQPYRPPRMSLSTYLRCLRLVDNERTPGRGVRFSDIFLRPLRLLKYPSIVFPAVSYGTVVSLGTQGPTIIAPSEFTTIFHFNSAQNGLAVGLTIVVGSFIGELFSGWVTDLIIRSARKRSSDLEATVPAELRLRGFWLGAIIVPVGLLVYGFTIQYAGTFIGPCIALGLTSMGAQIVSSVCFAYSCGDCYPRQSGDISRIFSSIQAILSLSLIFYEEPLANKIGFQWAFLVLAVFCVVIFSGTIILVFKGAEWRENAPDMPD